MPDYRDYKILLDAPATHPGLNFDIYAGAFEEIIRSSSPNFAIGIFGPWGSGKTTLMRSIEARLDPLSTVSVWFSAWRYEREPHLIVPLLDHIREAMIEWADHNATFRDIAVKTASTIGKVIASVLAGLSVKASPIPGTIEASFKVNDALTYAGAVDRSEQEARASKSSYHASFRALREVFTEFRVGTDKRIVIFIDDLDRCLPLAALEVLESMKLFFDIEGFVFVVGLDRQVIEHAVEYKYEQGPGKQSEQALRYVRGRDYIKKIFQVPWPLSPVAGDRVGDIVASLCHPDNKLPADQESEIRYIVQPHLGYIAGDAGVNPREIKRYINAYILTRKTKPELQSENTILALQTLDFRESWDTIREHLYTRSQAFIADLVEIVFHGQGGVNTGAGRASGLPTEFLDYVSPGNPGHDLLRTDNIDRYIYSTSITRDPTLISAVRATFGLGDLIEGAADEGPASGSEKERLTAAVATLKSHFQSYASYPYFQILMRSLDELLQSANELSGMSPGDKTQWKAHWLPWSQSTAREILRQSTIIRAA